jgi:hypothetical protein
MVARKKKIILVPESSTSVRQEPKHTELVANQEPSELLVAFCHDPKVKRLHMYLKVGDAEPTTGKVVLTDEFTMASLKEAICAIPSLKLTPFDDELIHSIYYLHPNGRFESPVADDMDVESLFQDDILFVEITPGSLVEVHTLEQKLERLRSEAMAEGRFLDLDITEQDPETQILAVREPERHLSSASGSLEQDAACTSAHPSGPERSSPSGRCVKRERPQ